MFQKLPLSIKKLSLVQALSFISLLVLFYLKGGQGSSVQVYMWVFTGLAFFAYLVTTLALQAKVTYGIKEVTVTCQNLSEGNFTQLSTVDEHSEFGDIAKSLNDSIVKLRKMMRSIEKAAESLNALTDTASINSDESAGLIDQQNEKVELIATAIEEMSATIGSVSEDVQEVSAQAEGISSDATVGRESLENLLASLNNLVGSVKESSETFDRVEESAKEINTVLEVITGVAEQTNLLALNAAIEAARAGEQGRGFAVVADEVRGLAKRTQDSAAEISEMTSRLSKYIHAASQVSDRSTELAGASTELAGSTSKSVEGVLEGVQKVAERLASVASAVEQQRAVSVDLSGNVSELAGISDKTVSVSERVNRDSSKVSELAAELEAELDELTLRKQKPATIEAEKQSLERRQTYASAV